MRLAFLAGMQNGNDRPPADPQVRPFVTSPLLLSEERPLGRHNGGQSNKAQLLGQGQTRATRYCGRTTYAPASGPWSQSSKDPAVSRPRQTTQGRVALADQQESAGATLRPGRKASHRCDTDESPG